MKIMQCCQHLYKLFLDCNWEMDIKERKVTRLYFQGKAKHTLYLQLYRREKILCITKTRNRFSLTACERLRGNVWPLGGAVSFARMNDSWFENVLTSNRSESISVCTKLLEAIVISSTLQGLEENLVDIKKKKKPEVEPILGNHMNVSVSVWLCACV